MKRLPSSLDRAASLASEVGTASRWWLGLVVGALSVAVLTVPKLVFPTVVGAPMPFLLYFGASLVAAYVGGTAAGLATTLFSAVTAVWLFIPSALGPRLPQVVAQALVFGLEGVALTLIIARLRRERAKAREAIVELHSAQEKLSVVIQGTDEGITLQNGSGQLVFANDFAATLTGCASAEQLLNTPPQELLGRFEMIDGQGKPLSIERLPGRVALQSGGYHQELIGFRTKGDSRLNWTVVRAKAVTDEKGGVRFVVNMFRDITEARQREEALQVAQEWFQIALDSIGDAVITTDQKGYVNLLNPVAEALTGWSKQAATGKQLSQVFHIVQEDRRTPAQSPVDRVLAEGTVVGLANHTLLIRPDGSEIAIDDSAAPIRNAAGELRGIIMVFRDVTAKRAVERRQAFLNRAVQELNSSLDYRRTLATVAELAVPLIADWCAVDIFNDGKLERLAVAHVDPQMIEVVRDMQRRYPSNPDAPRGAFHVLRTAQAEMMSEIPEAVLDAAAKNEEHRRFIHALGLRSYIAVPLCRDGKAFGVISLVMAESNRRYTEDDLALANSLADRASLAVENARLYQQAESAHKQAVLANRAKDDFLAMLGHELRNPLAPIQTALDLMRLRSPEGLKPEHRVIERQVKHLVRLVDDLLDVSRITHGRLELTREEVELESLVEHAVEMVWPEGTTRSHDLHIDLGPPLVVLGDRLRLAQVVSNLLTNAVKYTEPGGNIWISGQREGDKALLRVRDDGMGIEPAMQQQIFDMFVQEPQAIDRARGGLGLGLAIVRGIITAHGGSVSAASDGLGHGAEFVVELPIHESRPASTEAPREAEVGSQRREKILVVDDNTDAGELLTVLLSRLGHIGFTAGSAAEALIIAEKEHPTLAILDIGLPDMDGYELGRRLRNIPGLGQLRLAAATGYGQATDRKRSEDAGFVAHLVKPVSLERLTQLVGRVSAERAAQPTDGS